MNPSHRLISFFATFSISVAVGISNLSAKAEFVPHSDIKEATRVQLYYMGSLFKNLYGPYEWKKEHFKWDVDHEIRRSEKYLASLPEVSYPQAREAIRRFTSTSRDYHVNVYYHSTGRSFLPFAVYPIGNRFYISWIDRSRLPVEKFPYEIGDELVSFGGIPTHQAGAKLKLFWGKNVPQTDRSMQAMFLLLRSGSWFSELPQGKILLGFCKGPGSIVQNIELEWVHIPNTIKSRSADLPLLPIRDDRGFMKPRLVHNELIKVALQQAPNRFSIASKGSVLTPPQDALWKTDSTHLFDAYIYKTPGGKRVGFIRIPAYQEMGGSFAALRAEFKSHIERFQKETDALVIDQMFNPGGSNAYYTYLLSLLTSKTVKLPHMRLALSQTEVNDAVEWLKKTAPIEDDATAVKILGEDFDGYPVDYAFAQSTRKYADFVISEWKSGRTYASPFPMQGMREISPRQGHYTKPLVVLANEMSLSAADFFPAIIQDNALGVVVGTRTAGAGGEVSMFSFPNSLGISSMMVTRGLGLRENGLPLENLGVTPDVSIPFTRRDLKEGMADFRSKLNRILDQL